MTLTPFGETASLARIGLPGLWSKVRKPASVNVDWAASLRRNFRKSAAPAFYAFETHGAFSTT